METKENDRRSEQYTLVREYSFKLMSRMQHFREQEAMCDAILKVGEQDFPIHRVVLAAASPYFKVMFTGNMAETHERTINIHGVEAETFATVLDFIYRGHVVVCEVNVQELLPTAKMFQLVDLESVCCEFLKSQLDPSNCVGIYLFAETHSCENLSKTALDYICRNFLQVRKQEEFLKLENTRVLQFLESEELKIESEEQIFESAMEWILCDVPERRGMLGKVLERVRLPLISPKYLEHYLQCCENASLQRMLDSMLGKYRSYQLIACGQQKVHVQPRRASRKCFFIVGGYSRQQGGRWSDTVSLASVEKFDTFSLTSDRVSIAELMYSRSGHAVATVGGLIYAIGGENDSLISDVTECYNPVLNNWSLMSPLKAPRVACGVCVVEDFIFVIGGWVGSAIGENIERYDPQEDCWEIVGTVETKRFNLGVAEMNGIIYAVGGVSELGDELKLVESYNPVTEKWMRLADMHFRRANVGLTAMGGHLYAVGGSNEMDGVLASVEKYDADANHWTEVTAMKTPRAAAAVAVNECLLYVIGGRTAGGEFSPPLTLSSIDVYDPKKNKWKYVTDLCLSRCEFGVGVV